MCITVTDEMSKVSVFGSSDWARDEVNSDLT